MKALNTIGLMMAITVCIASCKKNVPTDKTHVVYKRISKMEELYSDGTTETRTFTYDAQGRPATIMSNTKKDVFSFQSPTLLLVSEYDLPDNIFSRTYECTLNEGGAISQMLFKNSAGVVTHTYTYTYDNEGYMTKFMTTNGTSSFEDVPTINNGNYVSSNSTFSSGIKYSKQYLYNTVVNTIPGGFYAYWPVATLFGNPSKNLSVEYKWLETNGSLYWHAKNSYTMSADGSVAKSVTEDIIHGDKSVITFTYE
ncbi:MAG: hypothetical protein JSR97_13315 [Verrucomicrobia bacterium]|nr:hypothetical protein [Verrucomicrobiota bacterium]